MRNFVGSVERNPQQLPAAYPFPMLHTTIELRPMHINSPLPKAVLIVVLPELPLHRAVLVADGRMRTLAPPPMVRIARASRRETRSNISSRISHK